MEAINKVCGETVTFGKKFIKFDALKKGEIVSVIEINKTKCIDQAAVGGSQTVFKAVLGGRHKDATIFFPGRVTESFSNLNKKQLSEFNNSFMIYHQKEGLQNKFVFAKTMREAKNIRRDQLKISLCYSDEEDSNSEEFECGQRMGTDFDEYIEAHTVQVQPKSALITRKKNNKRKPISESSDDDDICVVETQGGGQQHQKKKFSKEDIEDFLQN